MSFNLPHDHHEKPSFPALKESLSHTDNFAEVAEVFKKLGDTTRLRIFYLLCHCEECVTNIAAILDLSSPAVSHHLRLLKDTNLITSRREGKEVYYKASDTKQSALLHTVIEQVMEITCPEDRV